ncbi:MAG TPA: hypothetical protein PLK76_02090 [bacterium]|nr:hypothetical protein [bacterium]
MHFEKPVIQPITGQYGDINSMPLIIAMILGALVGFIIGGIYIYKKEKANKKQFGKKSWKLMAKKFK